MNALLFILLALLWGGSFLAIRVVVDAWPPFFGAAFRVALALATLFLVAGRERRDIFRLTRSVFFVALSGLISMGIGWAALFWGEQRVAPAVAAIITASSPIFTVVCVGWFDSRCRNTLREWIGVLLGFAGIVAIFAPQLRGGDRSELGGLIAVLLTAFTYGSSTALTRAHLHAVSNRVAAVWQALASLPLLVIMSAISEPLPSVEAIVGNIPALLGVCYLAFCSTALSLVIWFRLLRSVGAVAAVTVLYFVPLVSLLLDAFILHTVPGINVLAGACIILIGVALARKPADTQSQESSEPEPVCKAEGI